MQSEEMERTASRTNMDDSHNAIEEEQASNVLGKLKILQHKEVLMREPAWLQNVFCERIDQAMRETASLERKRIIICDVEECRARRTDVVWKGLAGRIEDELSTKHELDKSDGWKDGGRAISPVEKMR